MGFFDKAKELVGYKTRDNICAGLCALGVDAYTAGDCRLVEVYSFGDSTDLYEGEGINIREGPIRWVSIVGATLGGLFDTPVSHDPHMVAYGVPDPRLEPNAPKVQIKSVRVKGVPGVGKAVDLHWRGNDFGLGIINRLNSDVLLKDPITNSHDVKISAHACYGYWIISTDKMRPPSQELWNCYQSIAQHLLAEWPERAP
jgi:hypothetical protein